MNRTERLQELTDGIMDVFRGLQYGSINFGFDKLHCAMRCSICEEFDSVAGDVVMKVEFGGEVTDDDLRKLHDGLIAFKEEYKVEEVDALIKKTESLINESN